MTSYRVVSMICLKGNYYAFSRPISRLPPNGDLLTICLFRSSNRFDIILYILYMFFNRLEKHRSVDITAHHIRGQSAKTEISIENRGCSLEQYGIC